ncbi:MAG: Alpha/beta hydrolase fold-3 domain protein [Frankiales bacterium]|nr:Alpha/beta hydrolase fold-3 domain protein [Frankiales bacterium]
MRTGRVLPRGLPRPLLSALLVVLAVLAALLLAGPPNAGAALETESGTSAAGLPEGEAVAAGVVRQSRAYGPAGDENTLDVYLPADEPVRPRPTVLFVHGGSWEIGDKVEYVEEAVEVARRGWTAVSVNYRRTPTAPWPAPLRDVRAALTSVQADAARLGVDVTRTGALGDSVGGQLALLLGQPAPGVRPVRAVVAWSAVSDMPGLTQQVRSGGCATSPCDYRGLARKVVQALMRCEPQACPERYREASPAAGLRTGPATFSVNSETELVDPRQAWAMDAALSRARVASRVRVLPGGIHGRGYQESVWDDSLRFLAAALTPETAPAFPRPAVAVTLVATGTPRVGSAVRLSGAVRPRALGSSVALQVRGSDGVWHTQRTAPLRTTSADTVYDLIWTPTRRGSTTWRATWRGGGGSGTSAPVTVRVR